MAKKINTGDNPLFGGLNVPKKVSDDVKVNKNTNDNENEIENASENKNRNVDNKASDDVNKKVNITENKNVNVNENTNNGVKLIINKAEKTEQPERFTYLLYKRHDKKIEQLAKQAGMGKNEFFRQLLDDVLSKVEIQ